MVGDGLWLVVFGASLFWCDKKDTQHNPHFEFSLWVAYRREETRKEDPTVTLCAGEKDIAGLLVWSGV